MYRKFYQLQRKPFQLAPDPNFLYLTTQHQDALSCLNYGLTDGAGFIVLTGEIGAGKTLLVRHLINSLDQDIEVALVFNTSITAIDLLNLILDEFDQQCDFTEKSKAIACLYRALIQLYRGQKRALVIIDEAQNLPDEVLEEVRMLSNLQTDDHMLLQIILVGQPELRQKLESPRLYQLAQRIAMLYHLPPLSAQDVGTYISHRLEKAGGDPNLFTPQAVDIIHEASAGVPRSINLICDLSLVYGFADELRSIPPEIVKQVLKDKGGLGLRRPPAQHFSPPSAAAPSPQVTFETLPPVKPPPLPVEPKSAVAVSPSATGADALPPQPAEGLHAQPENYPSSHCLPPPSAAPAPPASNATCPAPQKHHAALEPAKTIPVPPPDLFAGSDGFPRNPGQILFACTDDLESATFLQSVADAFKPNGPSPRLCPGEGLRLTVGSEKIALSPVRGAKRFFLSWDSSFLDADAAMFLVNTPEDLKHASFFAKRLRANRNVPCLLISSEDKTPIPDIAVRLHSQDTIRGFFESLVPQKNATSPI